MASVIGSPVSPAIIPNSACELKSLDFSWVRDLIPPTPPPVTSDESLQARHAYTLALQDYLKLRTEEARERWDVFVVLDVYVGYVTIFIYR